MIRFVKSNRILSIGLIISILVLILYNATNDMPELFIGAEFLFNLCTQISLAYIGSFVFYIIQVYAPETKKKNKLEECVKKPLNSIIGNMSYPLNHFISKGEIKKQLEDLDRDDILQICKIINPQEKAPMIFTNYRQVTYMQYINIFISYIDEDIKQLIRYIDFIDADLLRIIDKIENSKYHENMKAYQKIGNFSNTDISPFEKELFEYYDLLLELVSYGKKNNYIRKNYKLTISQS